MPLEQVLEVCVSWGLLLCVKTFSLTFKRGQVYSLTGSLVLVFHCGFGGPKVTELDFLDVSLSQSAPHGLTPS